jgi:antitoxin HicB
LPPPIPNPVQHVELPLALTFFGLELLTVQAPHQLQDESIVDVRVLDLIVRVNDHLLDQAAIDQEMHLVASASHHFRGRLAEVARFSKRHSRDFAFQLAQERQRCRLTKSEMASRMRTSRPALDRLLDPTNPSVTLSTLERAASAVGKKLKVVLA